MDTIRLLAPLEKYEKLPQAERDLLDGLLSCRRSGYWQMDPGTLAEMANPKNARIHAVLCEAGLLILRIRPYHSGESFRKNRAVLGRKRDSICQTVRGFGRSIGLEELRVRMLYAIPFLEAAEAAGAELPAEELRREGFLFREDLPAPGHGTDWWERCLAEHLGGAETPLDERSRVSILQWLDPELNLEDYDGPSRETAAGAPEEALALTEEDRAVRLLFDNWKQDTPAQRRARLEEVNRFLKGNSRIIGCAGSGKSAVLAAKAVKAAEANSEKRFLITCFNHRLKSSYVKKLGKAAAHLKFPTGEEQVECMTFDGLCRSLLREINRDPGSSMDFSEIQREVRERLDRGTISRRYYGILIDEAQQFDPKWLRICYDLLESRDAGDHLFVICGDITQKMGDLDMTVEVGARTFNGETWLWPEARIQAPWEQAVQTRRTYPDFRFQDRVIRMETNYRCCAQINRYLEAFARAAREQMRSNGMEPGGEEFLPGKDRAGEDRTGRRGVFLRGLQTPEERSNRGEARAVAAILRELTEGEDRIPWEEIAILYYNKSHKRNSKKQIQWKNEAGWQDSVYDLEACLTEELENLLGEGGFSWPGRDEEGWRDDGDSLQVLSFERAPGLSCRAVILCGLLPLGEVGGYNSLSGSYGTKDRDWKQNDILDLLEQEIYIRGVDIPYYKQTASSFMKAAWENLHTLYMACSRARDVLYIVLPENPPKGQSGWKSSVYVDLLREAHRPGVTNNEKAET